MRIRHTIVFVAIALLLCVGAVSAFAARRANASSPETAKKNSSSAKAVSSKSRSATRSTKRKTRRERGQMVPTPERISEIQSALGSAGSYTGQPNGKWDAATVEGMKGFQTSHGLTPTGKLDALTLQKLGLGSETSGRGAPLPLPDAPAADNSSDQHP